MAGWHVNCHHRTVQRTAGLAGAARTAAMQRAAGRGGHRQPRDRADDLRDGAVRVARLVVVGGGGAPAGHRKGSLKRLARGPACARCGALVGHRKRGLERLARGPAHACVRDVPFNQW
jgi:hypothetical protein